MSKHDDLLALAERCEKALEPDRELDARIWCLVNGKKYVGHHEAYAAYALCNPETQVEFTEPPKRTWLVSGPHTGGHAKPVTASIDAAMTLVPEGAVIAHISQVDTDNPARKWFAETRIGFVTSYSRALPVWASTPALALTAACLKALASQESPQ